MILITPMTKAIYLKIKPTPAFPIRPKKLPFRLHSTRNIPPNMVLLQQIQTSPFHLNPLSLKKSQHRKR